MSIFPAPFVAHRDHAGFRLLEPLSLGGAPLRCLALAACVLLSLAGPRPATAEVQATAGSASVTFAPGASARGATLMDEGAVPEGTEWTFFLEHSGPASVDIEWTYTVSETGDMIADGYAGTGTVVMPAGEIRIAFPPVRTVDDTVHEPDSIVTLTLVESDPPLPTGGALSSRLVLDNDTPTVSIGAPAAAAVEGDWLSFPVTLDRPSYQNVTLDYEFAGTASVNDDYAPEGDGTLTLSAGETRAEIRLRTFVDVLAEVDESVGVTISNVRPPRGATPGVTRATGWIADGTPAVTVRDATALEDARLVFPVTLSPASSWEVTVQYAITPGTAQAADYAEPMSGAVTFSPGQTVRQVVLDLVDDEIAEEDETVTLALSGVRGGTLADGVATGTIIDNDGPPAVTVADATAAEGDGRLAFAVTLSPASSREVTVQYAITPGTAQAVDYAGPTSGVVTFAPGETAKEIALELVDDAIAEEDETVTLALSGIRGGTLAEGVATGTITDNDDTPVVAVGDATAAEGDGSLVFAVTLSPASSREVSVEYAITPGTAQAADYAGPRLGVVTFAPGETAREIALELVDDEIAEEDETVTLALSGIRGGTLAEGVATGTITDNDDTPAVAVGDATAAEGDGSLVFAVTLSPASSREVTVEYEFAPRTATENADYAGPTSGTVTFAPEETAKEIALELVDDEVDEEDETVTLALSALRGAAILAEAAATGTILDDDLPRVTVAAEADEVAEGEDAAFVLTRAGATTEALAVAFAVTGGDSVLASTPPVEAAFEAGAASARVMLATEDDGVDEADATVTLTLAGGAAYEPGEPSQAAVVIRDDDEPPEASVCDAEAVPEGGILTFPVRLSRPVDAAVTVDYVLAGTATAGEDYEGPAAGSVTFAPGETEKTIVVATVDDERDEPDETVEVTLSVGAGHDLGASRTAGVILDDDDPPSVTVSAAAGRVAEGESAVFVLRRTGDASAALTVELAVSERGGDMVPAGSEGSRRATFEAGATTATLAVATGSDGVAGPDSELTATLAVGDGYAVGQPDSATVAVSDGGGESLLAEGRRLGAASLLRRHAQRFSQLTSVAALSVLDGGRPPSAADLRADGDGLAASGDFGLDLPSGWDGWGSVRYSRLAESADGGVRDFYAGGSRVGADGRSVYGGLIGYESAPVTSRGVRLEAAHAQLGLYGARRFGEALTLDVALGWGRGDHDLSLVGGPYPVEASHRSTRLVARGGLTGDFGWGTAGLRIEPQLGLLYAGEDLDAFTDSLGGVAPGERLWLARLGIGPKLTWRRGEGATRARLRVNFDAHNLGPSGEDREEMSAELEVGHRRRLGARGSLDLSAGVDGLGSDWFSSTSFGLTYEGAF